MDEKIKEEWENDKTSRCPYCGSGNFEWDESDDGLKDGVHWFTWYCYCHECGNDWTIEYDMVNPRVY